MTEPLQLTIYPRAPQSPATTGKAGVPDSPDFWGKEGLSFFSFLDVINPLQHLPVISNLYRAVTGDETSTGAQLAGGALFGGPIGFAAALFGEIFKSETGKDVEETLIALARNDTTPHMSPNQRASYNAYVKAGMLA